MANTNLKSKVHNELSPFYHDEMLSKKSNTVRIYRTPMDASGTPSGTPEEVIRGIYKDEFTFGVQNQWQSGGSSILKMMVDTIGDMVTGRDAKAILATANALVDTISESNPGISVMGITPASAKEFINSAENYANSAIFSADDYFKSYKGSTVTVPTSVAFTLLSDDMEYDVFSDISRLLDISIGDFDAPEMLGGFVGVQAAPNEFKSDFLSLNEGKTIRGTITIVYGNEDIGGYAVNNMVVSNVGFSFSKAKVQLSNGKFRPLSVDIQLSVEPARMIFKGDVERILKI